MIAGASSVTFADRVPAQKRHGTGAFWPNGARMVISVSMQMESGAQPTRGAESPMPKIDSKYPDLPASKWYDYGYKEGLPRLLEVFDRRKIKVTSHMVGAAVDLHPELAKEIVQRGHEASAQRCWKNIRSEPSERRIHATRASLGPDQINEYASVVVLQVGQLVREVGEVVADASLQVLGDVMIDRGQDAAAALIDIREAKLSHLGQAVPLLEEPPVQPQDGELRGIVEETRRHTVQARLTQPVRVLAAHGPVGCEVVGKIERCDVTLLKELGRGVLQSQLIRGWDVIEVRVLD
jgi:hypothetical protein